MHISTATAMAFTAWGPRFAAKPKDTGTPITKLTSNEDLQKRRANTVEAGKKVKELVAAETKRQNEAKKAINEAQTQYAVEQWQDIKDSTKNDFIRSLKLAWKAKTTLALTTGPFIYECCNNWFDWGLPSADIITDNISLGWRATVGGLIDAGRAYTKAYKKDTGQGFFDPPNDPNW